MSSVVPLLNLPLGPILTHFLSPPEKLSTTHILLCISYKFKIAINGLSLFVSEQFCQNHRHFFFFLLLHTQQIKENIEKKTPSVNSIEQPSDNSVVIQPSFSDE